MSAARLRWAWNFWMTNCVTTSISDTTDVMAAMSTMTKKGERHDLTHAAHGLEHLRQDDEHERDALAAAEQCGVKVRYRREDRQTRDERHERVEDADHGGRAHEVDLLLPVYEP